MIVSGPNHSTFDTQRLGNGLQIVGQVMADFESVAVSYSVRTGARDERNIDTAGVSHFLEHMAFSRYYEKG